MGTRFVRFAGMAVLLAALAGGLYANAHSTQYARLELSRVFNPDSESLLYSLRQNLRGMSLLAQDVFNVTMPDQSSDADIASLLTPATAAPADNVNLSGVTQIRSYMPAPRMAEAPLPAIPQQSIDDKLSSTPSFEPQPVDMPSVVPQLGAPVHFGGYAHYQPPVQALAAGVSVPVRVGGVHFNEVMSGSQAQSNTTDAFRALQACGTTDENAACPYLRDSSAQSFVAGTDFNVRAGNRDVSLQFSSSVSHLSNGDAAIFPYVPMDPDAQLTNPNDGAGPDTSMLQYPGVADVVKHGVGARLNVPLTHRITLGLQYDRSHYQGDYANELLQGVDAYKDTYLGNVSYQLPNMNSIITLSARQYRYQDSFSPNFNLTQTRADLNLTVKF